MDAALIIPKLHLCCRVVGLATGVAGLLWAVPPASASTRVEREGSARIAATYDKNPDDPELYPNTYESSEQLLLRQSIKVNGPRSLRFEFNAYILAMNSSDRDSLAQTLLNVSDEANRASVLDRRFYRSGKLDGYLTVDRVNVRGKVAGTEITVGRFPINLTAMAIFTPNDFFAPYRPFDFYRDYKPGVDAVRFDHSLGKKGQISVMGVAGYASPSFVSRAGAQNQGSSKFSSNNSAALIRASHTLRGFELAAFGGKLGTNNIYGGSVQGEIGPVGLRGEMNQKMSRITPGLSQAEGALGIDYRLNSRIVVTAEQFYNGSGYPDATGYEHLTENPTPSLLLGRLYTGLAALVDITPLVHLKSLLVANDGDQSFLVSLHLSYSVTERLELGLAGLLPHGAPPQQLLPKSEFGLYPSIVSLQASLFF